MTKQAANYGNVGRARAGYFPVLDAMRFVLAFWVAVGHFQMLPLFGDFHSGTGLWLLFKRFWNTVVFGTPAVIVFFVISGFCIHLPFRGSGKIDVTRYYLRRYTRILIPVGGALLVYRMVGRHMVFWGEHSVLWESPLWSLACEEIYYFFYPFLRWLRNWLGWRIVLLVAFGVSVGIAALHPHAGNWHVYGPMGTALILLPVWLLGALLAEQSESLVSTTSRYSIWLWRFLAWLGCWGAEMLHFKLHVSYTQTMLWFGILAYFWVREELVHGKSHAPYRYLAAAGAWSYSLYLVHAEGGGLFESFHLTGLNAIVNWFLVMASSLAFAYVFYILVERPSHRLARRIKMRGAANAERVLRDPDAESVPAGSPAEETTGA